MSFKEPTPYAALQAENKEPKAANEELAKRKRQLYETTEDDVKELNEQCLSQAAIIEALKVENQKQAKIIELLQGPEDAIKADNAALRAENDRLKAICDRSEALIAQRNQELEQERETLQQARNTIRDLAMEAKGQAMMIRALEHDNKELREMLKAKDAFTEDLQGQVKKTVARRIDTLMVEPSVLHTMTVEDKVSDDEELVRAMTISNEEQFNNDLAMAITESLQLAGKSEAHEPSGKIDTGLLTTFYQNTKPDQL